MKKLYTGAQTICLDLLLLFVFIVRSSQAIHAIRTNNRDGAAYLTCYGRCEGGWLLVIVGFFFFSISVPSQSCNRAVRSTLIARTARTFCQTMQFHCFVPFYCLLFSYRSNYIYHQPSVHFPVILISLLSEYSSISSCSHMSIQHNSAVYTVISALFTNSLH